MIVFDNWIIKPEKEVLLRQFDHCAVPLKVTGNLPEGWEWVMLVGCGENMELLPMEPMEDGIGIVLTAERLAVSGFYDFQLRGKNGSTVRHTNMTRLYVYASMSGDAQWPRLPGTFSDMERRVNEAVARIEGYAAHLPILGENGNWWVWNGTDYEDSGKTAHSRCAVSVVAEVVGQSLHLYAEQGTLVPVQVKNGTLCIG